MATNQNGIFPKRDSKKCFVQSLTFNIDCSIYNLFIVSSCITALINVNRYNKKKKKIAEVIQDVDRVLFARVNSRA